MTPPLTVTEDTPADMLAGCMDLDIILPSGQLVRNSVLRSTPMMDLLVQVTTAHRLSPGSHLLQAMGDRGPLPYKPSTPIGALDTFTVRIVQKKTNSLKKAPQMPTKLPTTFRLSVHLPRSQLFVMRITPAVTIGDILRKVSDEKNLDASKYELRKSGSINEQLKSGQSIGELDTQELTLVLKGSDHIRHMSSADIMQVKQANNRLNNGACDSSLSSGSLDSRSISPVAVAVPQPPQRKKRRPAPKPPEINQMRISHSRESSDSSGYHEPSTLSESPTHGRAPSDTTATTRQHGRHGMIPRNSQSMSNLTSIPPATLPSSPSIASLSSNGGKKKRAAPPPPAQPTPTDEKPKSATLPADVRRTASASTLPPAPVELAPSPPTSPVPPVPKPRLSKSATIREESRTKPQVAVKPEFAQRNSLTLEMTSVSEVSVKKPLNKDNVPLDSPALPTPDWQDDERFQKFALAKSPKEKNVAKPNKKKIPTIYPTVQKTENPPEEESTVKTSEDSGTLRNTPVIINSQKETLPKTQSAVLEGTSSQEFPPISRRDEVSDLNLAKEQAHAFTIGSVQTNEVTCVDSENEEISGGDTFKEEITHVSKEPATSSSDGRTTDGADSQPDSLTVDWEYQLPPPPTHFRDVPLRSSSQMSPTLTDVATLGTVDTLNTLIVDNSAALRKLNGIYEDCEPESKIDKNEPDQVTAGVPEKIVGSEVNGNEKITQNGVHVDIGKGRLSTDGLISVSKNESAKVLVHKSEVMNELTNVLSRSRLPEKSQSFSNLYLPSSMEGKKKSSPLSHSQSFLNPPISNFKISNYDQRATGDADEFKTPAVPPPKSNGIRRSDSMNMKRVSIDKETLQQQFLQFLEEKQLKDSGVILEDLNVVPDGTLSNINIETVVDNSDPSDVSIADHPDQNLNEKADFLDKENVKDHTDSVKVNGLTDAKSTAKVSIKVNNASPQVSTEVNTSTSTKDTENWSAPKIVAMEPKKDQLKRYSYQAPAISMGTWGERPKSKVLIKDDDYITQDELTKKWATLEKSSSMSVINSRPEVPRFEAKEIKLDSGHPAPTERKTVISIKKPTNYELFSALNRRKELEAEEEVSSLPKVCGVELKKTVLLTPDLIKETDNVNKSGEVVQPASLTSSVYLNANQKPWNSEGRAATKVPLGLMPVVKGFRIPVEPSNKVVDQIVRQESLPATVNKPTELMRRQQSLPTKVPEPPKSQGIPPPPPMGTITLKPAGNRVIKPKACDDPRDQLLEQIRNFGGSDRLRKTVQ